MKKIDTETVKMVSFDDFKQDISFNRIDFVKIDVEGFEMRVLGGMKRLLEARKPALLIEVEERHNPRYRDVFDYLRGLRYEPYITLNGVALQPFDIEELPCLQSSESLKAEEGRKFRIGERKNYINNFFFFQPAHKTRFRVA